MAETPDETLKELLSSGSQLPPSELNARLRLLWPLLHGPQRNHDATALVALLRHAGYVSDGLPFPNGDLTVYRGELVSSREPGISWTTDAEVAKQYARGYATAGNTRVLQATAQSAAILARFNQEAEVVVAPELLSSLENLGGFPHFKLPLLR
jgi:hypothetical protein